jgi:uncharacterized protein (DUF58 family)
VGSRSVNPLPRLAPRGIAALLVLALVAFALAHALAWPLAVLVVACIFTALVVYDLAALRGEIALARLAPPRLILARRETFTYEIVNGSAMACRIALVEAPAPRLAIDVDEVHAFVPPRSRAVVRVGVVPRERGRTALRSFHVRITTMLGIVEARRNVAAPVDLRVAPDLSALDRSGDLVARTKLLEAGLRRLRRRGAGGGFASLREYGPDDNFRAIDWKASARRGRALVMDFEVERSQQIVIALDAGRLMTPRLGPVRKLDHAVSAALAIAAVARLAADRVGVTAFAATTLARLAPGSGPTHAARLLDLLSEVEPQFEESDYERAFLELEKTLRKRSLIVLFTDLFDPIASAAVLGAAQLLVRRHLVLVVLMNDAAVAEALRREPAAVEDAYRAAVAATLAEERARCVAQLQQRGILVVDVPAAELTVALLDAYVDIKTRGLL